MTAHVSVIIPAYKAAGTICRAVDSVLAQTHPVHEIIVIDDGSPDNQAGVVVAEYGDRVILVRQSNGKTAKARNTGIERATGDWIAFLDADDYWEKDKLSRQLEVARQHPEVGLIAGAWYAELPGNERVASPIGKTNLSRYDCLLSVRGPEVVRIGAMIWTGTVMIRRDVLGGERFVSGLEPAEDRDLWIRVVSGNPVYLLSEPLATAVLEPGSISRDSIETDCRSMMRVIERHRGLLGTRGVRIWRSYTLYRWSAVDPVVSSSIPRLIHSLFLWPFPFRPFLESSRLGRTRRFLILLRQALISKSWPATCTRSS